LAQQRNQEDQGFDRAKGRRKEAGPSAVTSQGGQDPATDRQTQDLGWWKEQN
jgi:hypothetical protein